MTDDAVQPDTKDWTWVLSEPCGECGFDPAVHPFDVVADLIDDTTPLYAAALAAEGARERPDPGRWSVLEYACHVRDVHRIFAHRLALVLEHDVPEFENWDQDATAVQDDYPSQDPRLVSEELGEAARQVADAYRGIDSDQLDRVGRRSNGSVFTVRTLAQYHLHDVVHHVHDIGWAGPAGRARATRAAYEVADAAWGSAPVGGRTTEALAAFAGFLGTGARVLEVGSGSGRDAEALEGLGLQVRRSDVTPRFVDALRAAGHSADLLDPLTDDLADPAGPYDGVWANASLLHVDRSDLPTVLQRLAAVTRTGGVLRVALKQGDGAAWSTHGLVPLPRHFTYWQPTALADVMRACGWQPVETVAGVVGDRDTWIEMTAVKA
ncbi:MAG: methyltransferase domain-containing protein [Nocardioides sp.]|uniref:methyltransferase domain-containing protein n=1 Tax=Nocardioides sp. TaxID=35761 RepID=UPI003F01AC7D